jgi:GAF domain-containing protein
MPTMRASEPVLLQQQTALARFGEFALTSENLGAILQEACRLVCAGLQADLAKVMELQPDGRTLLVRAGVGWKPGVVGNATSIARDDSSDGEALRTQEPVICVDVHEDRRKPAEFVVEHGVQSFVNVNILTPAGGPSYGILEVDCLNSREFTQEDIDFLRTYANLLAVVVQRLKVNAELQRRAEENERLLRELQHRIKNNLQILTSLIHFQARRTADSGARDELRKIGERIHALSLVHEKLHLAGRVDSVDLGAYLCDIARSLVHLHEGSKGVIRLASETQRIEVTPDSQ